MATSCLTTLTIVPALVLLVRPRRLVGLGAFDVARAGPAPAPAGR
jgi:hypothetical protein